MKQANFTALELIMSTEKLWSCWMLIEGLDTLTPSNAVSKP